MIELDHVLVVFRAAVLALPALLVAALGLPTLVGRPLSERTITRLVQSTMVLGLCSATVVLASMLVMRQRHVVVDLGDWIQIGSHAAGGGEGGGFHFTFKFVYDRLSAPFVLLTYALCGVISAFGSRYLHREAGFNRFFVLFAMFVLGMATTTLAGNIEMLFTGWELVGVSSTMLVAFFHERRGPVENGLRVWVVYRVSDAALLLGAVALHHWQGAGDFDALLGAAAWPQGTSLLSPSQSLLAGGLLVIAAAGKSALIPFSGWLPRAMEGPTPSSAIFYGALSVHLGAFLLLRFSPLLESSALLSGVVVALGLGTAGFAALTGRAQTDIKSALSFASLTQVGLIVAEIGMGWCYLALAHMLGHACLRTLQFLRAPSLLLDYHALENALGARLPTAEASWSRSAPARVRMVLYQAALHRGFLDSLLARYCVRPVIRLLKACDALERRWTDFLRGQPIDAETSAVPVKAVKEPL